MDFSKLSWKTSSAGILAILGAVVRIAFAIKSGQITEEAVMTAVTSIVAGIGLLCARDNDKSSVDAGIQSAEPKAQASTVVTPAPH